MAAPVYAPELKPLLRPVAELHVDPRNARTHPERSLEALKTSLLQYGQQKPIVVAKDGTVIAGNGTLSAALALGWKKIAAVTFKGSEEQARAFAIADNRTAELSLWDEEALMETLKELSKSADWNPEAIGFTTEEIAQFRAEVFEQPAEEEVAPAGESPAGASSVQTSSQVRVVHLFYDTDTQPVFVQLADKLKERWGLKTHSEVVLKALEELAGATSP
jgi:hypothetical protein